MPNHITNILTADADVLASLKGQESLVDFDVIVPMPECLKDFNAHSGVIDLAKIMVGERPMMPPWESKRKPTRADLEQAIRAARNWHECGYLYWYDWAPENWGTKWNAYSIEQVSENCIKFETAWASPISLISRVSASNPGKQVELKYADEDLGSNCGTIRFAQGEIIHEDVAPRHSTPEWTTAWTKFAFGLVHPDSKPADFCYNKNWEYDETLEA